MRAADAGSAGRTPAPAEDASRGGSVGMTMSWRDGAVAGALPGRSKSSSAWRCGEIGHAAKTRLHQVGPIGVRYGSVALKTRRRFARDIAT